MAKRQFRSLKEIDVFLKNEAPSQILKDGKLQDVLRREMAKSVQEVVYNYYVPTQYKRRGNGGLGDSRLMQITEAFVDGNNFNIIFQSLAEGNDTLKGELLASTIINGLEENWEKTGRWSNERDFVSDTMQRIKANPTLLINAVKSSFVKLGFKVR